MELVVYTLVIGIKSDPVLQYFFNHQLIQKDKRVLFINTDRIGEDIHINTEGWSLPCGGFLPHDHVLSVYNRMLCKPVSSHKILPYLYWLLDDFYPAVINRPKDTLTNFSKVWQLSFAQSLGVKFPQTAVYANAHLRGGEGNCVFKSISSIRSVVGLVKENNQKVVHEPVVIQEDKGRQNIRVHMIGDRCYAQRIQSKNVDYRYDQDDIYVRDHLFPEHMVRQVKHISNQMGLVFSGVDYMYDNGQYYFLEINPSPGYVFFEKCMKGSPITHSLYEFLRKT